MKMVALEARFADNTRQAALRQVQLLLARMLKGEVMALVMIWRVNQKDTLATNILVTGDEARSGP